MKLDLSNRKVLASNIYRMLSALAEYINDFSEFEQLMSEISNLNQESRRCGLGRGSCWEGDKVG